MIVFETIQKVDNQYYIDILRVVIREGTLTVNAVSNSAGSLGILTYVIQMDIL